MSKNNIKKKQNQKLCKNDVKKERNGTKRRKRIGTIELQE